MKIHLYESFKIDDLGTPQGSNPKEKVYALAI